MFLRVYFDLLGLLKISLEGYMYVLVIMCVFLKWIEVFFFKDILVIVVVDIFFRKIICKYGSFDLIFIDCG